MAAKNKTYWLSYDLGLKGDYPSLYRWLDDQSAFECGDSLAVIKGSVFQNSEQVAEDVMKNVDFDEKKDRLYIIEMVDGKMKGRFILGKRKRAPWEGYSTKSVILSEDF
jgi:hypothetical protein